MTPTHGHAPSLEPGLGADEVRRIVSDRLKVTDGPTLDQVVADFRGLYGTSMEYIRLTLRLYVPPAVAWLLTCCDNDRLRQAYEGGTLLVWTIAHPDDPTKVLVFESRREHLAR